MELASVLLDLLYPNRCPCCDGYLPYGEYVCEECLDSMEDPTDSLCPYCGFLKSRCECAHGVSYDRAIACYTYTGRAVDGVLSLKRSKSLNYAYHVGALISRYVQERTVRYDVVVPVPMCHRKRLRRGYNQAEEVAKVVARNLGVPMDSHALRVRYSEESQHLLTRQERIRHAKSIYYEGTSSVEGRYVVLVDDVMTTGSTLSVCSDILRSMGARYVVVAVATSAIPKDFGNDNDRE